MKNFDLFSFFESIQNFFTTRLMLEITGNMMRNVSEEGMSHFEAWNDASVLLINVAKTYCNIYGMNCFMVAIYNHTVDSNQEALIDLFELFLLYNFCDTYCSNILRVRTFKQDLNTLMTLSLSIDNFGFIKDSLKQIIENKFNLYIKHFLEYLNDK